MTTDIFHTFVFDPAFMSDLLPNRRPDVEANWSRILQHQTPTLHMLYVFPPLYVFKGEYQKVSIDKRSPVACSARDIVVGVFKTITPRNGNKSFEVFEVLQIVNQYKRYADTPMFYETAIRRATTGGFDYDYFYTTFCANQFNASVLVARTATTVYEYINPELDFHYLEAQMCASPTKNAAIAEQFLSQLNAENHANGAPDVAERQARRARAITAAETGWTDNDGDFHESFWFRD